MFSLGSIVLQKKKILLILIVLFLPASLFSQSQPQLSHRGYYFGFDLGPSANLFLTNNFGLAENSQLYSTSFNTNIKFGYAFIDNLIFYFSGGVLVNIQTILLKTPNGLNNDQKNNLNYLSSLLGHYGFNVAYYFPITNIFIGGGLLFMSGKFNDKVTISSDTNLNGVGFQAEIGKEWLVSNAIGVGFLARLSYNRFFIKEESILNLSNNKGGIVSTDAIFLSLLFTTSIQWESF